LVDEINDKLEEKIGPMAQSGPHFKPHSEMKMQSGMGSPKLEN